MCTIACAMTFWQLVITGVGAIIGWELGKVTTRWRRKRFTHPRA